MKIYNLTGSTVILKSSLGEVRRYEPEKFTAKAVQEDAEWEATDGIPTSRLAWHISGLPVPQEGVLYIVPPGVILAAIVSGRTVSDLRAPANAVKGKPSEYEKLVMA